MKNQCQHTGQNAAFKLLFLRIPIREILKKDEFWKKDLDFSGESEAKNRIAEIQETIDKLLVRIENLEEKIR